ncbi:hypothetical protein [Mucilaginibacter sp. SG564]|uniref:hypothetical protein n=1 Tax=Mucilaginibacter sp. SG564 TaxID=2587022 RepID=UPI0015578C6F|nr:hypothetical protein [Mucilaginibacter sp. SG564]NOW98535.1 hypothetical protein [Mucilaginibacter sp. SG564]
MKHKFGYFLSALLIAGAFFASHSYAQTTEKGKWRWSLGAEAGLPTGTIKKYSNFELGGTLRAQYGLSNSLALTFTSGYYNFSAKKQEIPGFGFTQPDDMGIIPVKVGIKSFMSSGFYWAAEAGAGFETPGGPVKLILSPSIGFASKSWDTGIGYEHFIQQGSNFGTATIRVAYGL